MGKVWFWCKKEELYVCLDTMFRPMVGEEVYIKEQKYVVKKISWHLYEAPYAGGIFAVIERV